MLGSGMIGSGTLLNVLVLTGCAAPRLVPLPDGVVIDRELGSAARTQQGVTVTVMASAWRGSPTYLEGYVTPFYVEVRNDGAAALSLGHQDLALFDEQRTQYNPLPPDTLTQILQADPSRRYPYPTHFGPLFVGRMFHPFHAFHSYPFADPFFPFWWSVPPSYPERWDDVFTNALVPGLLRPNARLQGFVYFRKLPTRVVCVVFEIGYGVEGDPARRQMRFSFALEPPQTWRPRAAPERSGRSSTGTERWALVVQAWSPPADAKRSGLSSEMRGDLQ